MRPYDTTGWHRKHAVRALSGCVGTTTAGEQASATEVSDTSEATPKRSRRCKYEGVRDALIVRIVCAASGSR
jgi:hypothetical protein